MWKNIAIVSTLVLAFVAGSASATTTPGWTTAKAVAQGKAKIRLPWCMAVNEHLPCGPVPTVSDAASGPFPPPNLQCRPYMESQVGKGEVFSRFACTWANGNGFGHGSLVIYVTGASKFRWKSL